ncbi:O-antigen ligase family protein [Alphaproteobacteria bacterium]|nr:O-antigen ligase family protein [Alphaproteobacteria bacterium]
MTANSNPRSGLEKIISNRSIIILLAIVPLIGVISPRAMAYMPAIIALLGYIGLCVQTRKLTPFNLKTTLWTLAVSGLILLSTLWTMDMDITLSRFSKTAPIFLGMVLMASWIPLLKSENFEIFMKVLRIILGVAGLYILFEFFTNGLIAHALHETDRFSGVSFMNRCVVVYFFCALPIFRNPILERADCALAALLAFVVFASDSQSIQLAFIIFALMRWVMPLKPKVIWAIITLAIAGLFLTAPFIATYLFQTLPQYFEGQQWLANAYASDRLEIWDFVARRALQEPWLGHGIEATRLIKDFDVQNIYFPDQTVLHPHNFALQIWIEFGLLGAFLFTGIIVFAIYEIWKKFTIDQNLGRFYIAAFIALLSVAATTYGIWQGWWLGLFGYILGCTLLVAAQQRTQHERK